MDNKIKEILESLNNQGITTTEIISNSGIGRTQFYSVLNGESIPKLSTAIAICKALKTDIKEVFPEVNINWKKVKHNGQAFN